MNRQIKFRAWDSSRNEMITEFGKLSGSMPEILQNEDDGYIFCGHYEENGDWFEPILMQFTGLYDKNGKEIYEGDVLLNNPIQGNRVVEYGSPFLNYAGYMLVNKEGMRGTLSDSDKLYEIIGNIYENPELLNK